jgi:aspartate carbamoyltransferase catalytic subunit
MKVAAGLKKEVERNGGVDLLKHRVLANVFMEPSTR